MTVARWAKLNLEYAPRCFMGSMAVAVFVGLLAGYALGR